MQCDALEGGPGEEARLQLRQMKECLDAVLLAVEKATSDLWLQPLLMRMVAREFVSTFARIQDKPLGLSRADPLEAARAMRHWFTSHAIFQREKHGIESSGQGLHILVDGNCAHADRCREQMSRGFPLACQRAMEYEVGVNERVDEPLWVTNRRLDPGRGCSFDLVPLRFHLLKGLEGPP